MLRIKVPATTANIGPGFDCLGLALDIHLIIDVYKKTNKTSFIYSDGIEEIPLENNLIYTTIIDILLQHNKNINFKIIIKKNDIPISRGLGSSASAIVAGVYAANYLLNNIFSEDELLYIACEIEGHPDNVVPAIKGGFQISKKINNKYITSKINCSNLLNFIILSPNFTVKTEQARAILPKKYDNKDVFTNLANLALLVNSFNNNDYKNIKNSLIDTLHQPYRINLINNGAEILKHSSKLGSYGEFISGSGPTLISIIKDNDTFIDNMKLFLKKYNDKWSCYKAHIDNIGVEIEVRNE
ncbi:MAG: homoserine kinase [Bacillota bacterium]|nr:homoserine kinase [Bacillota bacterium]